jgi:hypothetical protein
MGIVVIVIILIGLAAWMADMPAGQQTMAFGGAAVVGFLTLATRSLFRTREQVRGSERQEMHFDTETAVLEQYTDRAGFPVLIVQVSNARDVKKFTEGITLQGSNREIHTRLGPNKWKIHFE